MTEPIPSPFRTETRVLVPVALPDPEPMSPWLTSFLSSVRVLLLGCYVVPEQTSPEQARDEFEREARDALESVAEMFRAEAADVEAELVFTPDLFQSVERVAEERDVDAILRARDVDQIESILGVLTRAIDYDRFVKSLAALAGEDVRRLKLIQAEPDEEVDAENLLLEGVRGRLADRGVDEELVETEIFSGFEGEERWSDRVGAFDFVVVAEREPTIADRLVGTLAEEIFRECDVPVLLVRRGREA